MPITNAVERPPTIFPDETPPFALPAVPVVEEFFPEPPLAEDPFELVLFELEPSFVPLLVAAAAEMEARELMVDHDAAALVEVAFCV